jgi:hypothetical protein
MRITDYLIAIILVLATSLYVLKGPIERAINESVKETAVKIQKTEIDDGK